MELPPPPPGFRLQSAAPQRRSAPINTGVNPATVNANRGDEQFRYLKQRDAATDAEKRKKERREQAAASEALSSSATSIDRTIKILEDIRADASDAGGFFETGTTGTIARAVPLFNNAGKDLSRKLQAVQGLNAFSALKDLAVQGVKLTPISNAEIELAASSVANIDPDLSQEAFIAAVDQAISFHTNALNQIRRTSAPQPTTNRTAPPPDILAIMRKYGGL